MVLEMRIMPPKWPIFMLKQAILGLKKRKNIKNTHYNPNEYLQKNEYNERR